MITKATEEKFMHVCRSCGNKRELSYNKNDVKLTSRSKSIACGAVKCPCGTLESFTSASEDHEILKVICRLLLNEDK